MSKQEISKIWLTNKVSATLIIPINIARRHGLAEPSHVVVEEHQQGILIRKLDLNREKRESKAGSTGDQTIEPAAEDASSDLSQVNLHVPKRHPQQ